MPDVPSAPSAPAVEASAAPVPMVKAPLAEAAPTLPFDAPTAPENAAPEAIQRTPAVSSAPSVPTVEASAAPMPVMDISATEAAPALPFDALPVVTPTQSIQLQRQPTGEPAPALPFDNLENSGPLQRHADEDAAVSRDDGAGMPPKMDVFQALVAAGMVSRPIGDTGSNTGPLMQRSPSREAYLAQRENQQPQPKNERSSATVQRVVEEAPSEVENETTSEQEQPGLDVDKLARDVYKVLRSKLRDEFDRTNKR